MNRIRINRVIIKIRIFLKIIIMTVIIKRYTDITRIRKLLGTLTKVGKFDAQKFCGTLNLIKSPIEIQKNMRDEWQ